MREGHADLSCAACHDGPLLADREMPLATREGCTAAGCHQEAGPQEVQVAGVVEFPHRDHPTPWGDEDDVLTCAACHTHPAGGARLVADTDGCGLCHTESLDGSPPEECLSCHQEPDHVPMTNQGLPVAHAGVPWLQTGCVRCHYEVLDETALEPSRSCTACHAEDPDPGLAGTVGLVRDTAAVEDVPEEDPHRVHPELPCSSCHTGVAHRVVAQSTAVYLDCASCHAPSHWIPEEELPASGVCVTCHLDSHRAEQGLFTGLVPWDSTRVRPSVKFAAGLACAECHTGAVEDRRAGAVAGRAGGGAGAGGEESDGGRAPVEHGEAVGNDPESCVGCHQEEYRAVLEWWEDGGEDRLSRAGAYVDRARGRLGEAAVAEAARRLAFVDSGGFSHAPELADRLLREALAATVEAYRAADRGVPRLPELGPAPRDGFCSYCHLEPNPAWNLDDMPADFHREVMTPPEE